MQTVGHVQGPYFPLTRCSAILCAGEEIYENRTGLIRAVTRKVSFALALVQQSIQSTLSKIVLLKIVSTF